MQTSTVNKLIERVRQGDKDAFGQIYNLYLKQIYRFIYFSVRNREMAQDLTQDTFLKSWQAITSSPLSYGSFRAFLFTIARNLTIDQSRKKKTIPLEQIADQPSKESPEEDLNLNETKRVIWQALSKLKEAEKDLVVLHFFEELKYKEIAETLGKKEGSVRVIIHRILKKLKRYLKEE